MTRKLCETLRTPNSLTTWKKYTLEPTPALELRRGNVVLIMGNVTDYEVLQGNVSGQTKHGNRASVHTHVAVSSRDEITLTGGEKVLRVFDADDPIGRKKSSTPRTSPTSPMKPPSQNQVPTAGTVDPEKLPFTNEPEPESAFDKERAANIAENKVKIQALMEGVELIPNPPKTANRRKPRARPQKLARLTTSDIAYVVQSMLHIDHRIHRRPMPYTQLPARIADLREAAYASWECAVINTSSGAGEHWIVAMWNTTPELVLWEMYDRENSCMEDVVAYLKQNFPGARVIPHYLGLQSPRDHLTCGYKAAFVQLCIQMFHSSGCAPADMCTFPSVPKGWNEFLHSLLQVRDEQEREFGQVDCHTASQLGLASPFRVALAAPRFSFVDLKRQLHDYKPNQVQVKNSCRCGFACSDFFVPVWVCLLGLFVWEWVCLFEFFSPVWVCLLGFFARRTRESPCFN